MTIDFSKISPVKQLERLDAKEYLGSDSHLHIKNNKQGTWATHWHEYYEIEIILNGSNECHYMLNETKYELERYNAFFLTPVDFHQLSFEAPTEIINISFDETMLSDRYLSLVASPSMKHAFCFEKEELERLLMAVTLLLHEWHTDGNCQKQLFEYILEYFFRSNPSRDSGKGHNEQLSGIQKAILYMEVHFREKITLPALAQQAGLHPNYFSELFRKVTGKTYIEKLNQLRIDYACVLLRNGFAVSNACFSSGFGSLSNFLATFKARFGISPNEYKQLHAEKARNEQA